MGRRRAKACSEPGFDNPFFVRKMHEFLQANAGIIAYEAYFNGNGGGTPAQGTHRVAPTRYNPRSAAVYWQLWGR